MNSKDTQPQPHDDETPGPDGFLEAKVTGTFQDPDGTMHESELVTRQEFSALAVHEQGHMMKTDERMSHLALQREADAQTNARLKAEVDALKAQIAALADQRNSHLTPTVTSLQRACAQTVIDIERNYSKAGLPRDEIAKLIKGAKADAHKRATDLNLTKIDETGWNNEVMRFRRKRLAEIAAVNTVSTQPVTKEKDRRK
jgi:hypothetical protein